MGTILDYAERERHGFDERPFNAVDALILSSLAYQDMPDTVTDLAGVQRRYGTLRSRLKLIDPMHPIAAWRPLRRAPSPAPGSTRSPSVWSATNSSRATAPRG